MYDGKLVAEFLNLANKMNEKILIYAEANKIERGAQLNEDVSAILDIIEKYIEEAKKGLDKS